MFVTALLTLLCSGVFAAYAQAASSTKLFTDTKNKYSLQYPSSWTASQIGDAEGIFEDPVGMGTVPSYLVTSRKVNDSMVWTDSLKKALAKSWGVFVKEYTKEYKGELAAAGATATVSASSTYTLSRGYTASMFTMKGTEYNYPSRHIFVLLTKDKKTVHSLDGWYAGISKTQTLDDPNRAGFKTMAQSFKILK